MIFQSAPSETGVVVHASKLSNQDVDAGDQELKAGHQYGVSLWPAWAT